MTDSASIGPEERERLLREAGERLLTECRVSDISGGRDDQFRLDIELVSRAALSSSPQGALAEPTRTYRHTKSGGLYERLTDAGLEADRTPMVVYRGRDTGLTWVRPLAEFNAKFEFVSSATQGAQGATCRTNARVTCISPDKCAELGCADVAFSAEARGGAEPVAYRYRFSKISMWSFATEPGGNYPGEDYEEEPLYASPAALVEQPSEARDCKFAPPQYKGSGQPCFDAGFDAGYAAAHSAVAGSIETDRAALVEELQGLFDEVSDETIIDRAIAWVKAFPVEQPSDELLQRFASEAGFITSRGDSWLEIRTPVDRVCTRELRDFAARLLAAHPVRESPEPEPHDAPYPSAPREERPNSDLESPAVAAPQGKPTDEWLNDVILELKHHKTLEGARQHLRAALASQGAPKSAYEVHVAGPDDVLRFHSELEAHRAANDINKVYLDDLLKNPGNEVLCLAIVKPSTVAQGAPAAEQPTGEKP